MDNLPLSPGDRKWSPGQSPNTQSVYGRVPPIPLRGVFYSAGDPTSGHGLVFGEVSISWSGLTAAGEILPTDLEEA